MKTNHVKIIVIDNDPRFHEVYQNYFETYLEYSLEGIYNSVADALAELEQVQPDIIVTEVELPEQSGIDGINLFRQKDQDIKIVMINEESDFDVIKKAFKEGANGFLTKPLDKKRLLRALNSVRYEGATMSNDIARKVISMFRRKSYNSFSERENQIIDYLSQGATYKTIAEKLFVTPSTINFHIQNIYLKLNVNSKSEALSKLRELDNAIAI